MIGISILFVIIAFVVIFMTKRNRWSKYFKVKCERNNILHCCSLCISADFFKALNIDRTVYLYLEVFIEQNKDAVMLLHFNPSGTEEGYDYPVINLLIDSKFQVVLNRLHEEEFKMEYYKFPGGKYEYSISRDILETLAAARRIEFSTTGYHENETDIRHGVIKKRDFEMGFFKYCTSYLKKNKKKYSF